MNTITTFIRAKVNADLPIDLGLITEALEALGHVKAVSVEFACIQTPASSATEYLWLCIDADRPSLVNVEGSTAALDPTVLSVLRAKGVVDRFVGPLVVDSKCPEDEEIYDAAQLAIARLGFTVANNSQFVASRRAASAQPKLRIRINSRLAAELALPVQTLLVREEA